MNLRLRMVSLEGAGNGTGYVKAVLYLGMGGVLSEDDFGLRIH